MHLSARLEPDLIYGGVCLLNLIYEGVCLLNSLSAFLPNMFYLPCYLWSSVNRNISGFSQGMISLTHGLVTVWNLKDWTTLLILLAVSLPVTKRDTSEHLCQRERGELREQLFSLCQEGTLHTPGTSDSPGESRRDKLYEAQLE